MPFTFSHPALVLPFTKIRASYVSASCLIAGSIIPDFEYFIRMKASGRFGHTILGAFVLDLPLALIVLVIFHLLVKKYFINNLPVYFQSRLILLRDFDFLKNFQQNFLGYTLCLLIGIFSHFAWDSFTHANEFFIVRTKEMNESISFWGLPAAPLYKYLQHSSSLLGFGFIFYFFHHLPKRSVVHIKIRYFYWSGIILLASVIFLLRWSLGFEYFADVAATVMSSILSGIILTSLLFTLLSKSVKQ